MQYLISSEDNVFIIHIDHNNKMSYIMNDGSKSTIDISNFELDLFRLLLDGSSFSAPLSVFDIESKLSSYNISLFTVKNTVSSLRSKLRLITKTEISHKFIHNINRKGYYINAKLINNVSSATKIKKELLSKKNSSQYLSMYLSLITRVLFSKENFKVSAFILTSFTVILMLSIISVRSIAERKIDDFHRELHTLEMALKNDKLDDIECKELDWMLSQLYDKDRYLIASPEHYIIVDPNKSCTIRTRSSQSNIGYLFENYEFWFLPSESNNKVYIGMKDYPTGTNISNFNSGFYSNLVLRNFISLSLVNQSNSGEISLVDNRVENIISYNLVDYKNISISISPRLSLIILAILIPVYYPVLILLYTIPKGICKTKQSSIKIVEHDKLESTLVYQIIIKPHTISSSINKLCYAHSLIKSIVCTKYNTYGKNIIAYDFTNIDFSAIPYILRLAIIALLKNSSIIITDKTFSHYPSRGVEIIVLINDLNQLSTDSSYFNNEHVNILLNTDTSFISTCQLKEILSRSMVLLESIRVGSYLTKLATLNQTVF